MSNTTQPVTTVSLTTDQIQDVLLSARYGDLQELKTVLDPYLNQSLLLNEIKTLDENTLLHYSCANGHLDVVEYLVPYSSLCFLLHQNGSGNTALHWACLNGHLAVVKVLIDRIESFPSPPSSQQDQEEKQEESQRDRKKWDLPNKAGRGPMSEAQIHSHEAVIQYLLEKMIEGPEE